MMLQVSSCQQGNRCKLSSDKPSSDKPSEQAEKPGRVLVVRLQTPVLGQPIRRYLTMLTQLEFYVPTQAADRLLDVQHLSCLNALPDLELYIVDVPSECAGRVTCVGYGVILP